MERNIQLLTYRVNQLDFKFNEGIKPGTKFNINPKIECKVGRKDKTLFVNLSVKINDDISSPVPFNIFASLFATFVVKNEADQNVFATETMEVLYPFLRGAVASITANCNIPAYVLPFIEPSSLAKNSEETKGENLN